MTTSLSPRLLLIAADLPPESRNSDKFLARRSRQIAARLEALRANDPVTSAITAHLAKERPHGRPC